MKTIKYIAAFLLISIIIFFSIQTIRFVKKFKEMGEQYEQPDSLASPIIATNIRTSAIDTIRLNSLTIINFWATWCKPCMEEQAWLEQLAKERPSLSIIQFSEEPIEKQKQFLKKNNWHLPNYLMDSTFAYPPALLPTTFILKKNKVVNYIVGKTNWMEKSLLNNIDSLLQSN